MGFGAADRSLAMSEQGFARAMIKNMGTSNFVDNICSSRESKIPFPVGVGPNRGILTEDHLFPQWSRFWGSGKILGGGTEFVGMLLFPGR